MAALVERHGRATVLKTWFAVHGYPAEWATDPREVYAVAKSLERKELNHGV